MSARTQAVVGLVLLVVGFAISAVIVTTGFGSVGANAAAFAVQITAQVAGVWLCWAAAVR